MIGQVSMFGGADPADTPDADRCPACGGPTTTGAECLRCMARGHKAGHLELSALTTCNACDAAPMAPGQESPGEPGYCAGCLAETTTCRACGLRDATPGRADGLCSECAADTPDPHACPDCGGASRGFMLMTGHRQRECIDCRRTWLY